MITSALFLPSCCFLRQFFFYLLIRLFAVYIVVVFFSLAFAVASRFSRFAYFVVVFIFIFILFSAERRRVGVSDLC